jgi:MFS family permease
LAYTTVTVAISSPQLGSPWVNDLVEFAVGYIVGAIIVSAVVFGLPTAWLATQKGRLPETWLLLGTFLGPVAILTLGFAPMGTAGYFDRCVECREVVRADATTCPHCQTDLDSED